MHLLHTKSSYHRFGSSFGQSNNDNNSDDNNIDDAVDDRRNHDQSDVAFALVSGFDGDGSQNPIH